jgi:hypothetical protein
MEHIVEVQINGEPVYFEVEAEDGWGKASDTVEKVSGSFEKALDKIQAVISSTVERVRKFDQDIAPDEFQMEFGVKLSADLGAVITKVSGEAQLSITVTYKHSKTSDKQ